MSKVLILNGSPRIDGNTTTLLSYIEKGVLNMGGEVENILLSNLNIKPCINCLRCTKSDNCILKDDITIVLDAGLKARNIVFGTPVSNWFTSSFLKLILDRVVLTDRGVFENTGVVFAIITESKTDQTLNCMLNILMKLVNDRKMIYKGKIIASGILEIGDLTKLEDFKDEAITLGQSIVSSM
ncbi:hypothetical protein ES703_115949 [subsurface metagenome]